MADAFAGKFWKDNPQLIDKPSVYRWVSLALAKFGTNIMQKREMMVHVKNHKADLGLNFGRLSLAVWCEPDSYFVKKGNKKHLLNTFYYKERIEACGIAGNECRDADYQAYRNNCVVEKYYFNEDQGEVITYYKNPRYVKLGRDILVDRCTDDCKNKYNYDEQYSINIKGQTLYANFREGTIYMVYYELPSEEINGHLVPLIPRTSNRYLESYLELHIKRRALEDAMLSDDAPNKIGLYQVWRQDERDELAMALTDTSPIDMKAIWNAINKKRIDSMKYDLAYQ